ncbi:3-oxoacid CoA-transferase subunit B [Pusillimonas sp. ANT_WB101]|uniref:3-oxoacid CoA-transferase subunit B n=1 Tax=Pusillimonas sp. ANT_WB101 TaxID=2597356 RepID=UPI0011EFF196|nr:3-oxoacid CoA-transferase subunit B [Pusillimonas sp. ANT_WB101]KAA0911230.1 3-oxoacid CoA-transferase subunit B [Pusillimonas sp. ANT_WB101]
MLKRLNRNEMAERLAADIPAGSYVNIGIGMPELVARYLSPEKEVILQSENGILGMGPPAPEGQEDTELINAGKKPVTLLTGGAFFDHVISFAMMRGGHLDICIMGGMQVSRTGDLANWNLGRPGEPPAVGGAMDLAVGARRVFILMEHNAKDGSPKVLESCSLPVTGVGVVSRIYTDLAVLEVAPEGLKVLQINDGVSFDDLQAQTGAQLIRP